MGLTSAPQPSVVRPRNCRDDSGCDRRMDHPVSVALNGTHPRMIYQVTRMPSITLDNLHNGVVVSWWLETRKYQIVSLALAFMTCASTGGFSEFSLLLGSHPVFKVLTLPRASLFSVEKKIYKRLISMMLETM